MKTCRACGVAKPLAAFYVHKRDGVVARCKECMARSERESYYADVTLSRERARTYASRHRSAHPEQFTKEARRSARQREYESHRKEILERSRQWRRDHPGATREQVKAWLSKSEDNKLRYRRLRIAAQARRRARDGEPKFKQADIVRMLAAQQWRCAYCQCSLKETAYEVEHKTPIARGGRTVPENLCMACSSCNRRKGTRTADEFLNAA